MKPNDLPLARVNPYDPNSGYASSATHANVKGLLRRFTKIAPGWNKRPAHMEPRAAARARINKRAT